MNKNLVFGGWAVRESLSEGTARQVFIAQGAQGDHIEAIVSLAREKGIHVRWIQRREADKMVPGRHQGVIAETQGLSYASIEYIWEAALEATGKGPCLLILDGILDPQNFGSILRSAFYFGVPGVIVAKRRAAPLNSTVLRASVGAALHVPVAEVANLGNAMEVAKKKGIWLVGADMAGEELKTAVIPRPFALILGSEGEGIHDLVKKKCDLLISIKKFAKKGSVDSLNVGVAAGIMLHQFSPM